MSKFTEALKANKKTIIKRAVIGAAVVATVVVVASLYKSVGDTDVILLEAIPVSE